MKKILITGANGFLGQHLCRYFSAQNYGVIATGKGSRRIPAEIKVDYKEVDLTSNSSVANLLHGVDADVIIHTAAMSKPDECQQNPGACVMANVNATKHLLSRAADHFIYIS